MKKKREINMADKLALSGSLEKFPTGNELVVERKTTKKKKKKKQSKKKTKENEEQVLSIPKEKRDNILPLNIFFFCVILLDFIFEMKESEKVVAGNVDEGEEEEEDEIEITGKKSSDEKQETTSSPTCSKVVLVEREEEEVEEEEGEEIEINLATQIVSEKMKKSEEEEVEEEEDEIEVVEGKEKAPGSDISLNSGRKNSEKSSEDLELSNSEMGEIIIEETFRKANKTEEVPLGTQKAKTANAYNLINFFSYIGESIQSLKVPPVKEVSKVPPARSDWERALRTKNNSVRRNVADRVYKAHHTLNSNLQQVEICLTDCLLSAQKISHTMQATNQNLSQIVSKIKDTKSFVESTFLFPTF